MLTQRDKFTGLYLHCPIAECNKGNSRRNSENSSTWTRIRGLCGEGNGTSIIIVAMYL